MKHPIIFLMTFLISASFFWCNQDVPVARAVSGDGAVSALKLMDVNGNGTIDRVRVEIANPNGESWRLSGSLPFGFSITQNGVVLGISSANVESASSNPAIVNLNLNEGAVSAGTDGVTQQAIEVEYVPTAAYNSGSNLNDGADEQLAAIASGDSGAGNIEKDSASPIMLSATFHDENSDGTVETIKTTWSESVRNNSILASYWQIPQWGSLNLSIINAIQTNLYSSAVNVAVQPSISGTFSSTLPKIKYNGSNQIVDQAGNGALASAELTVQDQALPVITVLQKRDGDEQGKVNSLRLRFSETVTVTNTSVIGNILIMQGGQGSALEWPAGQATRGTLFDLLLNPPLSDAVPALSLSYHPRGVGTITDDASNQMRDNFLKAADAVYGLNQTGALLETPIAGEFSKLTITFANAQDIPENVHYYISLPNELSFSSAPFVTCSWYQGYQSYSVRDNTIEFTSNLSAKITPRTNTCEITSVKINEGVSNTGGFRMTIEDPDQILKFYSSISGVAIKSSTTGSESAPAPAPSQPVPSEPSPAPEPVQETAQEWIDPLLKSQLLSGLNVSESLACENAADTQVSGDVLEFGLSVSADNRREIVNFICYGISFATKAFGSGERRAIVRDYFDILRSSDVYWDDIHRMAVGSKPIHRNLSREQQLVSIALPVFESAYGHRPIFSNPQEDLAWNTLLYRIRFSRNLDWERTGISEFFAHYGRSPKTPFEWAVVRMLGYVQR